MYVICIYIYMCVCVCVYTKASTTLEKAWERIYKKKRRDGEIGEHKLNKIGALNMK